MVKKALSIWIPITVLGFTSCIKEESANAECDITSARANIAHPDQVFYQLSDTIAPINDDYGSSVIQFQRVMPWADLTAVAPVFTVSQGATLVPASGTARDFSNDATLVYYCVAEDAQAILQQAMASQSPYDRLAAAASSGQHVRPYYVQFKISESTTSEVTNYDFSHYYLETKGHKYYIWSDPYPDGTSRTVPNWATANAAFATARSSAAATEYPTSPAVGEGVDGGDAVKLETSSTGEFGKLFQMPLAAGNMYLGTFDMSQALTNTLHATRFGDNSTLERKPLHFTGYYKYAPGPQMTNAASENIPGTDKPAIYCIVYRNHDSAGNSVVLFGDNVEDSPLIVARAEVTDWQYNTTGWVPFSLDFTWYEELDRDLMAQKGYNYAIVCSSSKDGATYTGALGSTLLIDNFKLYFETED